MMNEQEYLNSKMGKTPPFTVPDGYFEQLAEQVMQQLPEKSAPARVATFKTLRPWLYAAASVCVALFTAAVFFNSSSTTDQTMQTAAAEQDAAYYSDNYIDEEADYAMVDNQDIYAYLLANM